MLNKVPCHGGLWGFRGISPIYEAECAINNGKLFALIRASINENSLLTHAVWDRFNCTSSDHLYLIA